MQNASRSRRLRHIAAAVATGALVLAGAASLASPALADTPGGNVPDGPYNLTITKLQNPLARGVAADGSQQDVSSLTPIAGVNFSVAEVSGVDLTTDEGWTTAAGLTVNNAGDVVDASGAKTYTPAAPATALTATDAAGVTRFSSSKPAVYLVTETSAPAGVNIGKPFLVTLPLPLNDTWLTDVFVYPKNTVLGAPVKTVDESGSFGVGDTVTWSITSTVPNLTPGKSFTAYTINDTLDARLTPPAPGRATVSLASSTGTAIPLTAANYAVTVAGQTVSIAFTTSGLALLDANPSAVISVSIPTVVNAVGDGTIQNVANQQTETNEGDKTDIPSTPIASTWGNVTLHKEDPNGILLKGAVFQVFTSRADAELLRNAVSVNGADEFTSDTLGNVAINGLRSQNEGAGAFLKYYLVETVAPAGFVVAPAFEQSVGGYEIEVRPGTSANALITVVDPQAPPIRLPLTGASGTAMFIVGGVALSAIAIGCAVIIVGRRRREAASADLGNIAP